MIPKKRGLIKPYENPKENPVVGPYENIIQLSNTVIPKSILLTKFKV